MKASRILPHGDSQRLRWLNSRISSPPLSSLSATGMKEDTVVQFPEKQTALFSPSKKEKGFAYLEINTCTSTHGLLPVFTGRQVNLKHC